MTPAAKSPYAGYRFPAEVISHAVWLYFRFPLSLRMVEEMLAARGIDVSHETVRPQVRPGLRQPDPPQAARPWRQVLGWTAPCTASLCQGEVVADLT